MSLLKIDHMELLANLMPRTHIRDIEAGVEKSW
jgi:hypothetical protein